MTSILPKPETVTRCCFLLRGIHVPRGAICPFLAIEEQADSNSHYYLAAPERLVFMAEHSVIGARKKNISNTVI